MPRIAPRSHLRATTSSCPRRQTTSQRRAQSTDDGRDALVAGGGGLPAWTDGIVDTGCIATGGSTVALADRKGNLYLSADTGRSWSRRASGIPSPSSVLIV